MADEESDPISWSTISSVPDHATDDNANMLVIETLDSESILGLKPGAAVDLVLHPITDGWIAEVPGTRIFRVRRYAGNCTNLGN